MHAKTKTKKKCILFWVCDFALIDSRYYIKNTYIGNESLMTKLGNLTGRITGPIKRAWGKRFGSPAQRAKLNAAAEEAGIKAPEEAIADTAEGLTEQAKALETANDLLTSNPAASGDSALDVMDTYNGLRAADTADMLEGEGSTAIDA